MAQQRQREVDERQRSNSRQPSVATQYSHTNTDAGGIYGSRERHPQLQAPYATPHHLPQNFPAVGQNQWGDDHRGRPDSRGMFDSGQLRDLSTGTGAMSAEPLSAGSQPLPGLHAQPRTMSEIYYGTR